MRSRKVLDSRTSRPNFLHVKNRFVAVAVLFKFCSFHPSEDGLETHNFICLSVLDTLCSVE